MEQYSYENAVYQANRHTLVHQYTTLAALDKIISNKSLRLTRIDLLNDTVENACMLELWQKKVFVSCFTHRESESYFFWKTYAKGDSTGVRLSLDARLLCQLPIHPDAMCEKEQLSICKETIPESSFVDVISSEMWGIYDVSLIDVMYISRNQNLENIEHHQGRFKYIEWDSEEETRLRVAIRTKCLEFRANGRELQYLTPSDEYVYVKLSDACLENLIITLSPFASDDFREKVEELLRKNNLIDKIQIHTSVLTGESR
ncbi:MAG: hypothetical protein ACI3VZ_05465 [Faecousia sp.]